MKWLIRGSILFWTVIMAFAQPGLPACWAMAHACEYHPHLSEHQANTPHTHDYLYDDASASGIQLPPVLRIPLSVLIAGLFTVNIWRWIVFQHCWGIRWRQNPETPPPRWMLSPL